MRHRHGLMACFAVAALAVAGNAQAPPAAGAKTEARELVLRPTAAALRSAWWSAGKLGTVAAVVERRMVGIGVAEPSMRMDEGANTITVGIPDGKTSAEVERLLTRRGALEMRYVPQLDRGEWLDVPETTGGRPTGYYVMLQLARGRKVSDSALAAMFAKPPAFTGADLKPDCTVELTSRGGILVHFEFRDTRKKAFSAWVEAHIGKRLAIFLDQRLITAPTINGPIPGAGVIEGKFTIEQAKVLAVQLNSGTLLAPLEVVRRPAGR